MSQNSRHLVSRLTWDTVFDSKAQGLALQDRLSDWSGFHLQQELSAVFDKFCPPEQTWKIQSLELDLGAISFENLEAELSVNIREQLNEKLVELIMYAHQRGKHIEILDEKQSHVGLIRYFLTQGLLPWNHQSADGSVNQILTLQLQNNREELLAMLTELGFSAEQIRQRMAWQFNEPNMVKIIEALEPNVGGQITLFANELTKIQQKETVVPAASTTDFKKNVWFWVLNYLLTERGTVFNRVQFMKSSIAQMAAHYNLQYNELFELIEFAVAKLSRSLSLQPDFMITLQLLSKENKASQKKKIQTENEAENHWHTLEMLFRNQSFRQTAGKDTVFNDLVVTLVKQDAERFKMLISTFGNSSNFWLPVISQLSTYSLKTVFTALKYSKPVVLIESILFLNRLMGGAKQQAERNQLWYKGLMFILEHQNGSFTATDFLQVLVTVLAQNKQLSVMALLDELLVAEVPVSLKTLRHTALYHTLTAVFMAEIARMPVLQFKQHLRQLITQFYLQVKGGFKDRKSFETIKNMLDNYARLHQKAFKDALSRFPYLKSVETVFPVAITGKTVGLIKLSAGITWTAQSEEPINDESMQTKNWLDELLQQPEKLLEFAKKEVVTEAQLTWFKKRIGFEALLKAMGELNPSRQPFFEVLIPFYRVLGIVSLSTVSASEMQYILFKKVMKAWTSGNWKLITAQNIWNELIWELCSKRGVAKSEFLSRMEAQQFAFPPMLQLAFKSLTAQYHRDDQPENKQTDSKIKLKKPLIPMLMAEKKDLLKGGVSIRNAGMVLISSYFPMLFTRLELTDGGRFSSAENQLAAVHYLQYVVTGQMNTEESLLPLNKLLCGLPLSQPVMESIAISEGHQELINGLIHAAIGYWEAIGQSSVDGFRGNWLVRDGLLTEKEDRWELVVDKRPYDLLIHKSPFSFSIIKYPWMNKPLHVTWPY